MGYLIMALQLLLSLSILVTLHEFGHFWPAKRFGMRVEKFYLFFDAWGIKLKQFKKNGTEYGIGWLPLGGYVKIAGMIDESMDTEQLKQPPQEWEFRSKPTWQRLIVMLGGVTVNFVLGFFLMIMGVFVWGDKYLASESAVYGVSVSELGKQMGLKDGDKILRIGDEKLEKLNYGVVVNQMLFYKKNKLTVERNGQPLVLTIADSLILKLPSQKKTPLYVTRVPFVIGGIIPGSPADSSNLFELGDSLVACNGVATPYFDMMVKEVSRQKNKDITVIYYRNGVKKEGTLRANEKGQVGLAPYGPDRFFDLEVHQYTLLEAIPEGIDRSYNFLSTQIIAFGQMFTGRMKASESLGGFVSIAKLFPTSWNWQHFWHMTAILSLILGFMNLLPIPALDGGHVMFLLYEMIARKPVSEKTLEIAQYIGFVLLISLLLFANGMDIYRLFE